MQSSILWKVGTVAMVCFIVSWCSRPAQAGPTFGGGRASCTGCHATPRDSAVAPSIVSAAPGDSVSLSIDVTDGSDAYSISLAGLGAAGLEGFTPDATWTDHFTAGTFNTDPKYGGPFYALSDSGVPWVPPGPVTHTFNLQLGPYAVPGTYDLTFTVAGSNEDLGPWRDANPFQLVVASIVVPGDFDNDGDLDLDDINLLIIDIDQGTNTKQFDLTDDDLVNSGDLNDWVANRRKTWLGDANLDGEFNSGDFVQVFQRGEYEDTIADNSGWDDGDWTGDREFNTSDFVAAFQAGGYERGPRAAQAALPEPSGLTLLVVGGLVLIARRLRLPTQV